MTEILLATAPVDCYAPKLAVADHSALLIVAGVVLALFVAVSLWTMTGARRGRARIRARLEAIIDRNMNA